MGSVLGLDIGTNSVGWALLEDQRIVDMGVHVFPLAVAGGTADVASGKYETKNATRREKRLMRRQNDRRKRRMKRVLRTLQECGLMPDSRNMAEAITRIDAAFLAKFGGDQIPKEVLAHVVPYALRKRGLDHELEPFEFGRAIYHLAQRRGFLSNRKSPVSDDEGVVKGGISELRAEMNAAGARTIGEFYAGLDPRERRIRGDYTARDMFTEEFDALWAAQKSHHGERFPDELYRRLRNDLFFQRSLKSQKHLVGKCPFEKDEKRCAWYRPEAQRFRLLQTVNHLRVVDANESSRALEETERRVLIETLERSESVTCAQARKIMGIKGRGIKLSIELDGSKLIKGDTTTARLWSVFGERWEAFGERDQERILQDLMSIETEQALRRRGETVWGLTGEALERFQELRLEDERAGLSRKAISRILPRLEEGWSYSEAVDQEYAAFAASSEVLDALPPYALVNSDLRNPVVNRSLTYVRRVVNAVTTKYGKSDLIRVELARDIKRSKKEKARKTKEINDRTKEREKIKERIRSYDHRLEPKRDDVLKVQLWEECGGICPYTGESIGWEDLFGAQPKFDIEHIIPFAVSLDDSFMNKTLCHHRENRHVKGRRSPWQAYGGDPETFSAMLARIETNFKGRAKTEKLRRFQLEDLAEFEDFSSRHLNDTRYASKLAMDYLALLYGGLYDADGKRRVQAVSGNITALLRRWHGMTGLLGSGEKTREDHRHHAVDAVAVALAGAGTIASLSKASAQMKDLSRLAYGDPVEPWPDFIPELKSRLAVVRTVHHQSKKVRGQLHEDTLYARQEGEAVHVRKKLRDMSASEVERIVDGAVRKAVLERMAELGEANPKKAFAREENGPMLKNGNVVKSARFARNQNTVTVGAGDSERAVVGGNNHHMEVVAVLNEQGEEIKWEGRVVSMLEAYERKRACLNAGKPPSVIERKQGEGRVYKFTLHCGDFIELDMPSGGREVFILRSVPQTRQLAFVKLNEARLKKDIIEDKQWFTSLPAPLRKRNARKVWLTAFGEVRYAHD